MKILGPLVYHHNQIISWVKIALDEKNEGACSYIQQSSTEDFLENEWHFLPQEHWPSMMSIWDVSDVPQSLILERDTENKLHCYFAMEGASPGLGKMLIKQVCDFRELGMPSLVVGEEKKRLLQSCWLPDTNLQAQLHVQYQQWKNKHADTLSEKDQETFEPLITKISNVRFELDFLYAILDENEPVSAISENWAKVRARDKSLPTVANIVTLINHHALYAQLIIWVKVCQASIPRSYIRRLFPKIPVDDAQSVNNLLNRLPADQKISIIGLIILDHEQGCFNQREVLCQVLTNFIKEHPLPAQINLMVDIAVKRGELHESSARAFQPILQMFDQDAIRTILLAFKTALPNFPDLQDAYERLKDNIDIDLNTPEALIETLSQDIKILKKNPAFKDAFKHHLKGLEQREHKIEAYSLAQQLNLVLSKTYTEAQESELQPLINSLVFERAVRLLAHENQVILLAYLGSKNHIEKMKMFAPHMLASFVEKENSALSSVERINLEQVTQFMIQHQSAHPPSTEALCAAKNALNAVFPMNGSFTVSNRILQLRGVNLRESLRPYNAMCSQILLNEIQNVFLNYADIVSQNDALVLLLPRLGKTDWNREYLPDILLPVLKDLTSKQRIQLLLVLLNNAQSLPGTTHSLFVNLDLQGLLQILIVLSVEKIAELNKQMQYSRLLFEKYRCSLNVSSPIDLLLGLSEEVLDKLTAPLTPSNLLEDAVQETDWREIKNHISNLVSDILKNQIEEAKTPRELKIALICGMASVEAEEVVSPRFMSLVCALKCLQKYEAFISQKIRTPEESKRHQQFKNSPYLGECVADELQYLTVNASHSAKTKLAELNKVLDDLPTRLTDADLMEQLENPDSALVKILFCPVLVKTYPDTTFSKNTEDDVLKRIKARLNEVNTPWMKSTVTLLSTVFKEALDEPASLLVKASLPNQTSFLRW